LHDRKRDKVVGGKGRLKGGELATSDLGFPRGAARGAGSL